MPAYNTEATDVIGQVSIAPVYDAAQAVTSVPVLVNFRNRAINGADAADIINRDTKALKFELLDAGKTVTVGGVQHTYAQIAAYLKKICDAERAAAG
jgi:hypothetical protein